MLFDLFDLVLTLKVEFKVRLDTAELKFILIWSTIRKPQKLSYRGKESPAASLDCTVSDHH